jgi:hypothetical protein
MMEHQSRLDDAIGSCSKRRWATGLTLLSALYTLRRIGDRGLRRAGFCLHRPPRGPTMRQCFIFLGCFALTQPEVLVSFAHEKIDPDGRVTDEKTREKIRELLASLVAWTTRLLSSRNV